MCPQSGVSGDFLLFSRSSTYHRPRVAECRLPIEPPTGRWAEDLPHRKIDHRICSNAGEAHQ